ncbi:MAG: hypothetical protein ACKV2O_11605 [Acidimicrobiales bacterium]
MAVHLVQLSGSATTAESAIRDLPGSRPEVRDEQVIRLADAPNGGQRAGRMVEGCGYVMLEGWGFSVEDAAGILNFLSCSYEGAPLGIGPWPGGPGIAFAGGVAAVDITLEYRAQDGTTVWLRQLRPKGQPLEHFFPYPGVEAATGARIPRASDERPWSAAWSGASGTVFLASARDALDLALLRARLTPVSGTALLDLLDRRSVNLTEAERAAVLGGSD